MSAAGVGSKRLRNGRIAKKHTARPETTFCTTYVKKVVESVGLLIADLEPVEGQAIVVTDDGIDYVDDPEKKYIYNYAVIGEIQSLLENVPAHCSSKELSELQTIFLVSDDAAKEEWLQKLMT